MDFKYKITKFDNENKTIVVAFDDGHWAEIRLTNPLPANLDELAKVVRQYTAPKEAIEAQIAPTADLTYIEPLIDVELTAERFSFSAATFVAADPVIQTDASADPIPVTVT